jgi:hypothetical protein
MGFESGRHKTGGRQIGVSNHVTQRTRLIIAGVVENNANNLSLWLDEVYQKDGAKAAFKCLTDLMEYCVPKLTRTEIVEEVPPIVKRDWSNVTAEEAAEAYQRLIKSCD